ncbi:coenzyme A pyrophosphatase [Chlorella sorokiniana]|uniref:Coenzyme A pyrophosphatase n=1 Tax=Chlorella sorokiniana TaxID=3076 RepID=A0A2P6U2Q4_CHLSO|nr:coenzyme A pyrophosphatase [Chlorella sorokiniana]|eukprot:PRW60589.1 coenzyme A pyrophosphatase [Chlorella sorokiniana]
MLRSPHSLPAQQPLHGAAAYTAAHSPAPTFARGLPACNSLEASDTLLLPACDAPLYHAAGPAAACMPPELCGGGLGMGAARHEDGELDLDAMHSLMVGSDDCKLELLGLDAFDDVLLIAP